MGDKSERKIKIYYLIMNVSFCTLWKKRVNLCSCAAERGEILLYLKKKTNPKQKSFRRWELKITSVLNMFFQNALLSRRTSMCAYFFITPPSLITCSSELSALASLLLTPGWMPEPYFFCTRSVITNIVQPVLSSLKLSAFIFTVYY